MNDYERELIKREESPETATIEGWITKGAPDANVILHLKEPYARHCEFAGMTYWLSKGGSIQLPYSMYRSLTAENSPIKVRITITPIEDE